MDVRKIQVFGRSLVWLASGRAIEESTAARYAAPSRRIPGDSNTLVIAGAGDVNEMPLRVVKVFEVSVIADGADAFFEWDDVGVAGHNANAAKLESPAGQDSNPENLS